MKRRNFILIASAGIAALSIPTYYFYLKQDKYDSLLAEPRSLSLIWDNETINDIGNRYRELVHGESKERSLVGALNKELSYDNDDLAAALDQKIGEDFASGNTVMIDGWILSVTEARQCALFSTIQPN